MSEYQYYEWQAVDRLLTQAEQKAVGKLSSHIEVSASRAVVTYSYGDFKHDPRTVLARFFDAHLYLANWGSRRLMFSFPSGLVRREAVEPYRVQDKITFTTVGGCDVLDLDLSEEEAGGWVEGERSLSGLLALREDLVHGDCRALYLAWLKAMSVQDDYLPQRRKPSAPPPVPAGLKRLSPALNSMVKQFDVPASLVEAAAEHSPDLAEAVEPDYRSLVVQLSREECDDLLCRFARSDSAAGVELRRRLLGLVARPPAAPGPRPAFEALVKRAEALDAERKERRKQEARRRHEAEMKGFSGREEEVWRQVAEQVDTKKTQGYEEAVRWLKKLAQLAEFQGSRAEFHQRVGDLCARYSRLSGFQRRVQQARLVE